MVILMIDGDDNICSFSKHFEYAYTTNTTTTISQSSVGK